MANNSRKRLRPPYMLLFIEKLKRHNDMQPKYVPNRSGTPQQRQTNFTLKEAQQNNRGQRLGPDLFAKNQNQPTQTAPRRASNSVQREPSDLVSSVPSLSESKSSLSSKALAANQAEASSGQRVGYISGVGFQIKEPNEGRAATDPGGPGGAANNRASDHFNQRSPGPDQLAVNPAPGGVDNQAEPAKGETIVAAKGEPVDVQTQAQLLPTVFANIQLQQLEAQTQKLIQEQQLQLQDNPRAANLNQASQSSMGQSATTHAKLSPSVRAEKLIRDVKDSGPQGLSQTPPAFVNNSGSGSSPFVMSPTRLATPINKNRIQSPFGQPHKKVSLSKIIAEQTPDAFKTLGPGFNIRNPGEKSGRPANEHSGRPALETVPSDYEHIFHAPSNMVDDRAAEYKHHQNQHKINHNNHHKDRSKKKKRTEHHRGAGKKSGKK